MSVLTACGASPEGGDGSGGDASAQLACRDFYALANEADLMTDVEIREATQGIWDSAQVSETPGIATAAREMLRTATNGDADTFGQAVKDMDAACASVEPL